MRSSLSVDLLTGEFFNLSSSLTAIVDLSGRFKEVNSACTKVLGYSADKIIGTSLFDLSHPNDHVRIKDELGLINATSNALLEYRFLCQDGTYKVLSWDVQKVPAQEIYIFLGRDISTVEKTKKSLQETKNTLNSVIESIPAMIFMKDAKDLRFTRLNRGGEALLGIPREDLIGKNDYDLFTKDQADFFVAKDRDVLNSNSVLDIAEEPIQNSKGETIYLRTSKVGLRDINGVPTHLLGISIDITERRNAAA